MAKVLAKVGALLLCGSFGVVLAPGCTIRIGPGTGEDGPSNSAGGATEPDDTSTTDGDTLSSEEQAALKALHNVDPAELSLKTAATTYAAVTCASLVESQIADPATVDEATVRELFEQYAPLAADEALAWMETVDPSLIPLQVLDNLTCQEEPWNCPWKVPCSWGSEPAFCFVSQCGKGPCPWCPFLSNLVYKHWCVYGCVRSGKLIGGAVMLKTRFPLGDGWNGPHCMYFGK
jgi:hypothetical protein